MMLQDVLIVWILQSMTIFVHPQ